VQTFQCTAASVPGFIRKNSTNYLGFDDGSQYIPVGEDMAWQDANVYVNFNSWLTKLSDNKGNFIRLWMPDWGIGLEWKNGNNGFAGLKQYKQTSGYYLDWLLDFCKQKNVYAMVSLDHHGQVSTTTDAEWANNPYNNANGGPCVSTWDFFTDTLAKSLIKNRFRYIIARYGWSKNIMCWELFNEVEWTDNFTAHKADISTWHDEMAKYIKATDVNQHLVTTSYAMDNNDPVTWNLPSIDFTQTHYYVGSPNLESVLSAGITDYLSKYNKPSLNGEFGLGGNANLSTIDPNGLYIHNALWGTAFSGAMGPAMSWWWDNYIDPQNLYYHFKPLSTLLSSLTLKNDNYKRAAASTTGGGTADLSISPGAAGFGGTTASTFTLDASGNITPGASQLGVYLYGNSFNTQYRNPPSFTVNYPLAGQFKVITGSSISLSSPKIEIYIDGSLLLDQAASASSTYSVNVNAGSHVIKVDNLGVDWLTVSSYVFTNIGTPLIAYSLKSADTSKAAGWVLNKQYNWSYFQNHGNTAPPAITGASVNINGMQNGAYSIQLSDCISGTVTSTLTANVSNSQLSFALPVVNWDLAFVANRTGAVTAVIDLPLAKQLRIYPNPVSTGKIFIEYELTTRTKVAVEMYDLIGEKISTIFEGNQNAGQQRISYSTGSNLLSRGVYLLKITIGKDSHIEKIYISQ
jgi:hypothetical protein